MADENEPKVANDQELPSALAGPTAFIGTVVIRPLQQFFRLEAASGILLFLAAVAALIWANSPAESSYRAFVNLPLEVGIAGRTTHLTLLELVNDVLMTLFFFVVGLEIKRELVLGELRTFRTAALPAIAAIGGMVVPAGIFAVFTWGGPGSPGWGIPMATDIAFCIGAVTLLRSRVPRSLVVFLTALAIFDDIGGILVIALFYGHGLSMTPLLLAVAVVLVVLAINRTGFRSTSVYVAAGVLLWYGFHAGGVHATIAGVVLGLLIPATAPRPAGEVLRELSEHTNVLAKRPPDAELERADLLMIDSKLEDLGSPIDRLVHALHPYVAFGIAPLFALTNAGLSLAGITANDVAGPVSLGAGLGLLVGKPVGIFLATLAAVKLGAAPVPGCDWAKVFGVSVIAGIGFTVALFIAALAFPEAPPLLAQAKIGIMLGSLSAGLLGAAVLLGTQRLADDAQVEERAAA